MGKDGEGRLANRWLFQVVPTGYSFQPDGTTSYMTLAAVHRPATDIDLSLGQQLALLLVAIVVVQGAAGVTGAGLHHPGRHPGQCLRCAGIRHGADPRRTAS